MKDSLDPRVLSPSSVHTLFYATQRLHNGDGSLHSVVCVLIRAGDIFTSKGRKVRGERRDRESGKEGRNVYVHEE